MADELIERIERRLTALGISARKASIAAGLSPDFIRDIKRRTYSPSVANLHRLARGLETSPGWLQGEGDPTDGGSQSLQAIPQVPQKGAPPKIIAGATLAGDRNFPVYAATQGGSGHLIVTFDPIRHVRRPEILGDVTDGYGLLITGRSMFPMFDEDDIALVNPRLNPKPGKAVVLYHTPPSGEVESMIKLYGGETENKLKLSQFNPPKDFEEDKIDWPVRHRVVGRYDG